jgi:hypothetical protein
VRTIWDNTQSLGSLHAVDSAAAFEVSWRLFTLYNWNRGEVDHYFDWDQLTEGARGLPEESVGLGGQQERTVFVDPAVRHLAAQYRSYSFSGDVREIEFRDRFSAQDSSASVMAVITYGDGSQRVRDLSDESVVKFCRDEPDEDVVGLLLIFANGSIDHNLADGPQSELVVRDSCRDVYVGTVTGSYERQAFAKETWTATVRFEQHEGTHDSYWLASGTITYKLSGTDSGGCTWQGTGTFTLDGQSPGDPHNYNAYGGIVFNQLAPNQYFLHGDMERIGQHGYPIPLYPATYTCPHGGSGTVSHLAYTGFLRSEQPPSFEETDDRSELSGTHSEPNGGSPLEWSWKLTRGGA